MVLRRVLTCKTAVDEIPTLDGYRYQMGARITASFVITDEEHSSADMLRHQVERTKRQIIEAVFGEFRDPIYALREALMEADIDAAHRALDKLQKQMFDI